MNYLVFAREYKNIFPDALPDDVKQAYEVSQRNVNLGTRSIRRCEDLANNAKLSIDYGRLLEVIQGDRELGQQPILVGYRPPSRDTLWERVRNSEYDIIIFDRWDYHEKDVGYLIDEVIFTKTPTTIALVSGDGDFYWNIKVGLERGWNVEIWAWNSGLSFYAKNSLPPFLNTTFMPLEEYYRYFSWCYDNVSKAEEMRVLKLSDGNANRNWGSNDVMECFVELNLFGWWHRDRPGILLLYFRNQNEMQNAQAWLSRNHPEIWAGELVIRRRHPKHNSN
ncbi:hypothetical protein C1646_672290 [Rhizophagus diaphanus]|nr:hypothetical protein C1646_672290 [Rhizophagus diaphanus] [Rhizophagus sp. MUCL 43196]